MSGYIQTNKGFPGSWHTRDKTNDFTLPCSGVVHEFFDPAGRDTKILGPGVITCDGLDRVLCVKRTRSFNNGRRGMIWGTSPVLYIEPVARHRSQSVVECLAKIVRIELKSVDRPVIVSSQFKGGDSSAPVAMRMGTIDAEWLASWKFFKSRA